MSEKMLLVKADAVERARDALEDRGYPNDNRVLPALTPQSEGGEAIEVVRLVTCVEHHRRMAYLDEDSGMCPACARRANDEDAAERAALRAKVERLTRAVARLRSGRSACGCVEAHEPNCPGGG